MNTRTRKLSALLEQLEPRQMLAVHLTPLSYTTVPFNGGNQLQIWGSMGNDVIGVDPLLGGFKISNGAWFTTIKGRYNSIVIRAGKGNDRVTINPSISTPSSIYGGIGDDTLNAGAGNDKLYGQGGADVLNGGAGDDILVNIGDSAFDKATGGAGFDSFWTDASAGELITDASAAEIAGGAVHQVGSFFSYNSTTRTGRVYAALVGTNLNGDNLADPQVDDAGATYKNFSSNPLFATTGPSCDDIVQGYVGDCWYLSTLAAIARTNANAIKQAVVELGDGTYAVQFANADGSKVFVRVDGDLPQSAWGGMQYAGFGKQNSLWVAIMEKAYACFREAGSVANYASLDGGWMNEAFSDLGFADSDEIWNVATGDDLLNKIDAELKAGKAVTMAIDTPAAGAPVVGSHAYTVVSVDTDADGHKTLVLRNPWGIDGAGNDGKDDGYVRLTPAQALGSFWAVISANVR
jgi:hypothetical protein